MFHCSVERKILNDPTVSGCARHKCCTFDHFRMRHLSAGKNVLEINPAGSHQPDGPDDSIMGLLAGGPKASRPDKEKNQ
jgi:hypothetical protein